MSIKQLFLVFNMSFLSFVTTAQDFPVIDTVGDQIYRLYNNELTLWKRSTGKLETILSLHYPKAEYNPVKSVDKLTGRGIIAHTKKESFMFFLPYTESESSMPYHWLNKFHPETSLRTDGKGIFGFGENGNLIDIAYNSWFEDSTIREINFTNFNVKGDKAIIFDSENDVFIVDLNDMNIVNMIFEHNAIDYSDNLIAGVFSPNEQYFTILGSKGKLLNIDIENKRVIYAKNIQKGTYDIKYTVDGKYIVPIDYSNVFRLIDPNTGEEVRSIQFEHKIHHMEFAPNGINALVTTKNLDLFYVNLEAGKIEWKLENVNIDKNTFGFFKDGKEVFVSDFNNNLPVLYKANGTLILKYELSQDLTAQINSDVNEKLRVGVPRGHSQEIKNFEFSPDGKLVLTYSEDNSAIIWDVESQKSLHVLTGGSGDFNHVEFNNDGTKILANSSLGVVRVWDTRSGKQIMELKSDFIRYYEAHFNSNGENIITRSVPFDGIAFNWKKPAEFYLVKETYDALTLYNLDGSLFYSSDEFILPGKLEVWDPMEILLLENWSTSNGKVINNYVDFGMEDPYSLKVKTTSNPNLIYLSPGYDLYGEGDAFLIDLSTMSKIKTYYIKANGKNVEGHEMALFIDSYGAQEIELWDITEGTLIREIKIKGEYEIETIQMDSELNQCILLTYEGAEIYDLATGELIQSVDEERAWSVTYEKEKVVKAPKSSDKIILDNQLLDMRSGDTLMAYVPSGAKFSPDGKRIAYVDNMNEHWGLKLKSIHSEQEEFLSSRSSAFSSAYLLRENDQLMIENSDYYQGIRTTQFFSLSEGKMNSGYNKKDLHFYHKDFDEENERELRASFHEVNILDLKSGEVLLKSPDAIQEIKILELGNGHICRSTQQNGNGYYSSEIVEVETNKVVKDLGYTDWKITSRLSESGRYLNTSGYNEYLIDTKNKFNKIYIGKASDLGFGVFNKGENVYARISGSEIKLINPENGKVIINLDAGENIESVQISEDGKRCLAINSTKVILIDAETKEILKVIECLDGNKMTLLNDESYGFCTKIPGEKIVQFNLEDGEQIITYDLNQSKINGYFINSELERIVVHGDSITKLYDFQGAQLAEILPLDPKVNLITGVSRDGKFVTAFCTAFSEDNTVLRIYDRISGQLYDTINMDQDTRILKVDFVNDSLYLIKYEYDVDFSGDAVMLTLRNIKCNTVVWDEYVPKSANIQFTQDSSLIYYSENYKSVKVFNLLNHESYYNVDGEFYPGEKLWYNYFDGILNYIDPFTLDTVHTEKYFTSFNDVRFAGNDGEIYLRKERLNNNVLDDYYVEKWNLNTAEFIGYEDEHVFVKSTEKKRIRESIRVASIDGTDIILDENDTYHTLKGHEGTVLDVFEYDRNRLVSTSTDGSIIVWDLDSMKMLIKSMMFDNDPNMWVHIHASGAFDASPGAMQLMYWTKGLEVIDFAQLKDRYWVPGLWEKVMKKEPLSIAMNIDDIKLQPKVELGDLQDGKIPVKLIKREGGYGDVSIYINGKEIIQDARGTDFDESKNEQTIYVDIEEHPFIQNGENEIMVKASSEDGFIQGRGDVLKFITEKQELQKPSFFGVIIGVNDYVNDNIDLKYPSKDARAISKAVGLGANNLFGTDKNFIYTITSDGDVRPNKENIKQVFTEIAEKAKSQDVIMIYLSGHGVTWGGEQESDFFFLTADATAANKEAFNDPVLRTNSTISTSELVEWIKDIPALKQVMIIDACGSGKAVDNLIAARDVDASQIKAIDRMKDRTGMFVISGCTADAVSYEASQYGQGLLTYSILQAMKGAALKEDKYVDVFTILEHARETVPSLASGLGGVQEPQFLHPKGGSFDIGLLNDEDKMQIPIEEPKRIFVRSAFINLEEMEDDIELSVLLDEKLSVLSSKGEESDIVFFDTKKYPNACRVSGGYSLDGETIALKLKLRCDEESDKVVELKAESVDEMVQKIMNHITQE